MPLGILENGEILRGEFHSRDWRGQQIIRPGNDSAATARGTQAGMAPEPASAKTVPGKSL